MKKTFYLQSIVYAIAGGAAAVFLLSFFIPAIFQLGFVIVFLLLLLILIDVLLLFTKSKGITAIRNIAERFSMGDNNKVTIVVQNHYGFSVHTSIIDEMPYQFQARDWVRTLKVESHSQAVANYFLKPLTRGEYDFYAINVFVHGPLQLVKRRYIFAADKTVKVYPSYVQMRKYQLLAATNKLEQAGVKKIRKIGHSLEFEQIKEYVRGDDYRTINWQATARKNEVMVNNYTDERSQQVYCLINKGRVMKMPFDGMPLLDYAINATLALANVTLVKQDRIGLITFSENIDSFLPADKKPMQMTQLLESLYRQKTKFLEPDYEKLFSLIRNRISNRGLLVLFTNFESVEGLQRELPILKKIARYHLLLIVFFENTELKKITEQPTATVEEIYIKTIAEKFVIEKKLMVKELQLNGIAAILTTPDKLTLHTINKYIELKNRMSI